MNKTTNLYEENGCIWTDELSKGKDPVVIKKYCFKAVRVNRIYLDLQSKKVELELLYSYNGKENLLRFSRSIMTKNEMLRTLPSYGIDVTDLNVSQFVEWLAYQEQFAKIFYNHVNLGWQKIGNETVYLLDKAISKDNKIISTYSGNLKIAEVGTLDQHLDLLKKEVRGNVALEFAYVAGLSSILIGYIKDFLNIPVMMIHLYGNSSTGKSTALQLGLAPFGMPFKAKNSIMITWYSTINSIGGYLKNKRGFCFGIDESSSRSGESNSSVIYSSTDGLEKGRSDINGNAKEQADYSGTILSTGESSLLQDAAQFEGLRVRLIEITLKHFTTSAENSKNIQRGLQKNYANTARVLAQYLLNIGEDEAIMRFKECHKIVMNRFVVQDQFSDRTADRFALIYLTGLLANESLNLSFNIDKVLDLLVNAEEESILERNIGEKAYRVLLDFMSSEPGNFYRWQTDGNYIKTHPFKETYISYQKIKGRIDFKGSEAVVVYFLKETLDKILIENGFYSPLLAVKAMKEKGYLFMDGSGKLQVNRLLYPDAPARTRLYGIRINSSVSNLLDMEDTDAPKERIIVPMKTRRKTKHTEKVTPDELFDEEVNE